MIEGPLLLEDLDAGTSQFARADDPPIVSIEVERYPGGAGTSATVDVGTVTTLDPGEDATVDNSGTSLAAILDFGIPRGEPGEDGADGYNRELNPQTGTSYTFTADDEIRHVTRSNASASTQGIPTNASVPFPLGTYILVTNLGGGDLTWAGASGVAVNGLDLQPLGTTFGALKTGTNTWYVSGLPTYRASARYTGNHTVLGSQAAALVMLDGTTVQTVTVPTRAASTPPFRDGSYFYVGNSGTEEALIDAEPGVTLIGADSIPPGGLAHFVTSEGDVWVVGGAVVGSGSGTVTAFQWNGSAIEEGVGRIFTSPEDPESEGFTGQDGDVWIDPEEVAEGGLSDANPEALGTVAPGVATLASRDDHVHPMPSAADVGAAVASDISDAITTHEGDTDPHGDRAYTDSLLHAASVVGSVGYRPADLDTWFTAYAARATTPVDVVIVGDSIGGQDSLGDGRAWPWHFDRLLNGKVPETRSLDGWRVAQAGVTYVPGFTTNAGTASSTCPGANGVTMTNGQKATLTATMDGISLVYDGASTGDLIIRDGVGGTVLTTLDLSAAGSGWHVWTSGALTSASHTIEVESVGNTKWAGAYIHNGNRASGARVWNLSKAGATTANQNDANRCLTFIENMQPDLVIVATGTNDGTPATYDTQIQSLLDNIQADYSGPIALWVPYISSAMDCGDEARAVATAYDLATIDAWSLLGGQAIESSRWAGVGVHPSVAACFMFARQASAILAGDPFAEILRNVAIPTTLSIDSGARTATFSGGLFTVTDSNTTITLDLSAGSVNITDGGNTATFSTGAFNFRGDAYLGRTASASFAIGTPLSVAFAGVADGLLATRYVALNEASADPSAPAANNAIVYTKDNGSGKTQLCVRFATGAVQVIATEP